jgi:hypothetical protein
MQEYVKVMVEQTKVEMVVTKEYYETYPNDLRYLGKYKEPEALKTKVTKVSPKTLKDK